ncbi:hypothetical protein [Streptomyces pseudogriseolus]|uniref:hypothetical protein n=1 Tax=Streptomyces pseudogriseolus TaxID=36817 RepID=UPI003FA2BF8F
MTADTAGRGAPGAVGFLARIGARAGGPGDPGLVRPRPATRFEPAAEVPPAGGTGTVGDGLRPAPPIGPAPGGPGDAGPEEPAAAPVRSAPPRAAPGTAAGAPSAGTEAAIRPRPPAPPRRPAPAAPAAAPQGGPGGEEPRDGAGPGPAGPPEPGADHEPPPRAEPREPAPGRILPGDRSAPPEPYWYPGPADPPQAPGGTPPNEPGGAAQGRAAARHRPQTAGALRPSVRVTIGRVEVRALPTGAGAPERARPPEPAVSGLEQYLRRRTRRQE